MPKPILVSGVQPSGRLHIGNYLGALKNFVALQDSGKYECYFFIADLHSLTEDFDPKKKHEQVFELFADFLALGLDPKKSLLFQQSQIPAHSELAWILNTLVPIGELRRMTQFKEKSEAGKESANAGLLIYPTLMAADVMLYDAKFVPVGEDQLQHLELARTLARKFNKKFGETFVEPQPLLTRMPRVMSLTNPQKKMSKSQPDGCLFIDDSPEEIKKKVRRAVTDSGKEIVYDPAAKPAISNLLDIYSAFSGEPVSGLEKRFAGQSYREFKEDLARLLIQYFAEYRKKKRALRTASAKLRALLAAGSKKAAGKAEKKIAEARRKVGINIGNS